MGIVGLLMKRFTYYKEWVWTTKIAKPKLFIGSFITPILEAVGIRLGTPDQAPASMDIPYLQRTQFLTGKDGKPFAFPFWSRDFDPVPKSPDLAKREPGLVLLSLLVPSDADDEGPITPGPKYGTERYYFAPYRGLTTSVALRHSLSQNAKLQRWNKMQDRTLYKLKESVKVLKRQMKKGHFNASSDKQSAQAAEGMIL
ncbi:Uncharacterized protein Rs2_43502 [Raphanus sativus]|nr:Uncharacterized protein Rs2_43502 [Raphanus sativus]